MHILIHKYDIFLLGSKFWLYNICNAGMLSYRPLSKAPHKLLEVGRKKAKLWYALVRNQNTNLSDPRESFEEQSYIYIFKIKQNPNF
jgi:hypothetical protein